MDLRLATWEGAELRPGEYNLSIGQPHGELLPSRDLLSSAFSTMLAPSQDPRHPLQYSGNMGTTTFLQALSIFLTQHYGFPVDALHLFTTNGCSQALELACQCFARPGDVILIEEPAYHYVHKIFTDNGLIMHAAPQHPAHGGLDVDALEAQLKGGHVKPRLLYTIPSFNNPTGTTLSADSRRRLVELAHAHNFVILSDEVYQLLYFTDEHCPPPVLAHYAMAAGCPDSVLSLGSFSKLIAPGFRLGWIQTSAALVKLMAARGFVNSGGGLNPLTSSIVEAMMTTGALDVHMKHVREQLALRARALVDGLNHGLAGAMSTIPYACGGYFVWLQLPSSAPVSTSTSTTTTTTTSSSSSTCAPTAAELLDRTLAAHHIRFLVGTKFSHTANQHLASCLRLSFAYYSVEELRTVGEKLGASIREYVGA